MPSDIIIAVIALFGTTLGSGFGVVASSKLTNYRIQQLEKKMDKHNNLALKTIRLCAVAESTERRLVKIEHKLDISSPEDSFACDLNDLKGGI